MLQNEKITSANFNEFYKQYYRKAFLFAKSYVHDVWIAEDIASEAIISLLGTIRKHEIHHPLTFLFSVVKNKSIDHLRHELIRQEVLAQMSEVGLRELNNRIVTLDACEPEMIYSEEIKTIVDATLNSLPERTREIFLMSRFQGLTKEEIAAALGITSKGVDYHISNALKNLRITLKDYLPVFCFFPLLTD
ncbi:MAG: RNA polymerase sigma-70 factor [Tannerellaceae bacterium]|jgi:RNA polymerase sigma-70 factor (ECF subfamily)|nr:RNA polymerase sigma-70 factor [Tannerellaceae bacterium]